MRTLVLVAVIAAMLAMVVPAMAADGGTVQVGAIGVHTLSGKTMAGVCLGLSVIPASDTNKYQNWAAKHITLDILQTGSALDATSVSLGASINLLAPEGKLKIGGTYLFQEREPAIYIGYSVALN